MGSEMCIRDSSVMCAFCGVSRFHRKEGGFESALCGTVVEEFTIFLDFVCISPISEMKTSLGKPNSFERNFEIK